MNDMTLPEAADYARKHGLAEFEYRFGTSGGGERAAELETMFSVGIDLAELEVELFVNEKVGRQLLHPKLAGRTVRPLLDLSVPDGEAKIRLTARE